MENEKLLLTMNRADEVKVLVDLARDKWVSFWVDNKLMDAAKRLVEMGLVRVREDDEGGPRGRYELWPITRDRLLLAGAHHLMNEKKPKEF